MVSQSMARLCVLVLFEVARLPVKYAVQPRITSIYWLEKGSSVLSLHGLTVFIFVLFDAARHCTVTC